MQCCFYSCLLTHCLFNRIPTLCNAPLCLTGLPDLLLSQALPILLQGNRHSYQDTENTYHLLSGKGQTYNEYYSYTKISIYSQPLLSWLVSRRE